MYGEKKKVSLISYAYQGVLKMDPIAMALMGAAAIKVCKDFRDWKPPPEAYEKNPLPSNPEKLREQASHIGLLGPHVNVAAMTPKGQLFQHIFDSHNICRSTNKASIVLFGDSGTGKSSTVNHLFGTEVAAVSEDESETSETIEYKLLVDDNKFMIKDLLLSIIDTPGCNDTRGTDQDAFNTLCIKEFFEEYHGLTQNGNPVYPNMVLFLIRSDEPRLKGRNSNFSKGLRIAQYLQLIDHKNPNVIVILTRAQNILPPMENEGKLKKVKENVQEIVFKVLNIPVQIVCIENKYENLPKNGEEATELGNGELQPMNLYQAMKNLLERNGDRLGHLALNKCFENPSVVKKCTGTKKPAKTAEEEKEPFDPKVMEILDFLNRNRNTGVKMSESSIQVQKYVEQNKATVS